MACAIYAKIAARCKIYLVLPVIPVALSNAHPYMLEVPILSLQDPTNKIDTNDLRGRCVHTWTSALALIQYWEDAQTLYEYGRPIWHYSKLMFYVFYQINLVLKCHDICIYLYLVLDRTP